MKKTTAPIPAPVALSAPDAEASASPDLTGEVERTAIFENLKRVAATVVRTFGRNCEIAIHDFRDLERSLVHLEGTVTGRKLGAPITNLVIRAWRNEGDAVRDMVNYPSKARSGHNLKSSTTFVRNAAGQVIGAFCINFDLTELEAIQGAIGDLGRVEGEDKGLSETFAAYVNETNEAVMAAAIAKAGKHPSVMSREEKLEFIRILDEEGAFLIKGMVNYVAKTLSVTIYTVYNYLRQIKGSQR